MNQPTVSVVFPGGRRWTAAGKEVAVGAEEEHSSGPGASPA